MIDLTFIITIIAVPLTKLKKILTYIILMKYNVIIGCRYILFLKVIHA